MVPVQARRNRGTELAQAIERQIVQRTWGRIHRLEVEVLGDRVVVHGYTQTFHTKQLALQGVLDCIGFSGESQVELAIQVDRRAQRAH